MKKLESFKKDLFVKELSNNEIKKIKGSIAARANDTGTHPTATYANGKYMGQDCADNDGID